VRRGSISEETRSLAVRNDGGKKPCQVRSWPAGEETTMTAGEENKRKNPHFRNRTRSRDRDRPNQGR
jgi:hypothetical protein